MKAGQRIRVLRQVMKRTGADKIWTGFLIQLLVSAGIIWLLEPEIPTYGNALWYCYAVVTTIGFGDVVARHLLSRVLSVLLSVSAALVIALITGVVVNYYNQITQLKQKETISAFLDRLEHLPELSREELLEISQRVKEFQRK